MVCVNCSLAESWIFVPHQSVHTAQVRTVMKESYPEWEHFADVVYVFTSAVMGAANYKTNQPLSSNVVYSCFLLIDSDATTYNKDEKREFGANNHVDFDILGRLSTAEANMVSTPDKPT